MPIFEAHMVEDDRAASDRSTRSRHRRAGDRGRRFHQGFEPLDRRERRLQRGVLRGDVAQRREEHLRVLDEGDQRAELTSDECSSSPPPIHRMIATVNELSASTDGEMCRFVDVRHHCDVAAVAIEFVEFAAAFAFAREELDHRHAAQRLGEVGVEGREPFANLAIDRARPYAEEVDDQRQRRNRAERP